MLHDLLVALFAMTTGFTASGIVSNAYRLLIDKQRAEGKLLFTAHIGVMIIAGPSVMFENAMTAIREKSCSAATFWLSVAVSGYWSLSIGLVVLEFAIYFAHR
ncbi:MAG TPA: hypothetical protein VK779_01870 [Rhizomicrobium sp.]|jgi:hypothetical protein|nr:hypothetical protein [Rhizomicrobium sp.]